MKVYIHIGSTKTGSSALQSYLYDHRAILLESRILYPDVGIKSGAHHLLASCFHHSSWNLHKQDLIDIHAAKERFANELRREFARKDADTVIISSEYLWTLQNRKEFVDFILGCGAKEVEVTGYIREISDWLQSEYNQSVKYGNALKFKDWLEAKLAGKVPVDYKDILGSWNAIEGVKAVSVGIYSDLTLPDGIFSDFLTYIGFKGMLPDSSLYENVNPSPAAGEIHLMAILNSLQISHIEKSKIRECIMHISPKRKRFNVFSLLDRQDHSRLRQLFSESLRTVKENYVRPDHSEGTLLNAWSDEKATASHSDDIYAAFLRILIGINRTISRSE